MGQTSVVQSAIIEQHSPAGEAKNKRQPRVLIVDDDPRALRIFRRILSQADRECLALERAAQVPEALRLNPGVEVILSDLRMPQVDGLELIRQVRKEFSERSWLQFILVTGQASIETVVSALRLDAVDYLFKPVMPRDLLSSVRRALVKTESARALCAKNAERMDAPSPEHIRSLARAARAVAAELSRISRASADMPLASELPGASEANLPVVSTGARRPMQEHESLRFLMSLQDVRNSLFGEALLPDPAWEMLAELMLAQITGRRIAVTSLCLASKSPVTTALRRIDDLMSAGLTVRTSDPTDRRRSYIELSEHGRQKMQRYLLAVAERRDQVF